jgi:hypothetical protein
MNLFSHLVKNGNSDNLSSRETIAKQSDEFTFL